MEPYSYRQAGVDRDQADDVKREMGLSLLTPNPKVLNTVGAFASLYDGTFPGYEEPVLVMKTEEPGSKQKLAFQYDRVESICQDMIHHLLNDIAVMGAHPLFVQDAIICGKLEATIVARIVAALAEACRSHHCVLTGGETSEQPGILQPGDYILTSSVVGVVEKQHVIDGSRIHTGDVVVALASSGLHTNGYSLVRALLDRYPDLLARDVAGESFLEATLRPHRSYYLLLRDYFATDGLHGLAHITGGGIQGNLNRILPPNCDAQIDLRKLQVPQLFGVIRSAGRIEDAEMLRTFNMGAGLIAVLAADSVESFLQHTATHNCPSYVIGSIVSGSGEVQLTNALLWEGEDQ